MGVDVAITSSPKRMICTSGFTIFAISFFSFLKNKLISSQDVKGYASMSRSKIAIDNANNNAV